MSSHSKQNRKPTRAEWFAHVEQWRMSGMVKSEYCRQHGINIHSLGYWITRHSEQTPVAPPLTLIPAKVNPAAKTRPEQDLILRCPNGSLLQLPGTVPAAWLGQLLAQLR